MTPNMTMASTESTAEFGLTYAGDALAENTMDVRDLAPALLAFGELFSRANDILNGEDISVSLKVRATKPGSFELLLILSTVFHTTTQFLSGDLVTSAVNLKTLVVGGSKAGTSLFGVFKRLKGQRPIATPSSSGVTLKASNIELHVPTEVFRLYQDKEINRLAQAVVEPLFRSGIDEMVVKEGGKKLESVTKDDAATFTPIAVSDGTATENIIPNLALRLVSPTFTLTRNKWRLDDGGGPKSLSQNPKEAS
jgi:hypothetical protein